MHVNAGKYTSPIGSYENEQNSGCLGFFKGMKYYPELNGAYNKPWNKDPLLNNLDLMDSKGHQVFFFVAHSGGRAW